MLEIVLPAEDTEAVEVEILPSHRCLDGGMQGGQRRGHCDFDPPPGGRFDAEQRNPEPHDRNCCAAPRRRHGRAPASATYA